MEHLEDRLAPATFPQFNLVDPGLGGGDFGAQVVTLSTGNIAVTDPAGVGAVYLFNGHTGALLSALTGTGDGPEVTALTNGNFVVVSQRDATVAGAVTWGSGTTGVSGVVSAANSLVGIAQGNAIGQVMVTPLTNGNYVVDNYRWDDDLGAVTWGNGTTGTTGVVSAANSLVGSKATDWVGMGTNGGIGGVLALANGNYVVDSPDWNGQRGAVTWGNGTTGSSGTLSTVNSLVGSNAFDRVGSHGVTALTNGNYVVASAYWNTSVGAATWGNGTAGVTGTISPANSLIGSSSGDFVGAGPIGGIDGDLGVVALTNGNYVVLSPDWNVSKGAATWGNGAGGITGTVSSANSLIGSGPASGPGGDAVGNYGVTALTNGNYVVDSPYWNNQMGAATWGNGTAGTTGVVSAANSLVGSTALSDQVGGGLGNRPGPNYGEAYGVIPLANGNYVVDSPSWNGARGAVTWGDGTAGVRGTLSAANSLVGTNASDHVGGDSGSVFALTNGNYVVTSPDWNFNEGAATWGNGTTGLTGAISASNSLVGNNPSDDKVGNFGVTALTNGDYVVASLSWNSAAGAVTWGNGATGTTGTVSGSNSLINLQFNPFVGAFSVTALPNGNYVVSVDNGNGGFAGGPLAASDTWVNGATGLTLDDQDTINAQNSLMGVAGAVPLLDGSVFVATSATTGRVTLASPDPHLLPSLPPVVVSPTTLVAGTVDSVYPSPTFTATGGSGSGYTFSETGTLPLGLTFNATTDQLVGAPTQSGTFTNLVITATDGSGDSGSQTYSLTINPPPVSPPPVSPPPVSPPPVSPPPVSPPPVSPPSVNQAPVINPIGSQMAATDGNSTVLFTVTATAQTSSGTPLAVTYSLGSGVPAGTSINPQTGLFTWTPSEGNGIAPGVYSVTVAAADTTAPQLVATATFSVTVGPSSSAQGSGMAARLTVAQGVAQSAEYFSNIITAAYNKYLGRAPEAAGLAYWLNLMQTQGLTDEHLEAGFIGSQEYITDHGGAGQGWVIGMYQNLLGRTPAASEVQYWLSQLAANESTTDIAYGFAASQERESQRVAADYQQYLGRSARPDEIQYWVSVFLNGANNEKVIAGFVSSQEYFQTHGNNIVDWLFADYRATLQRVPDSGGYQYWLTQLQ